MVENKNDAILKAKNSELQNRISQTLQANVEMRRIIDKANSSIAGIHGQLDTAAAERADIDQNLEKQEGIDSDQRSHVVKLEETIAILKKELESVKEKQINKFRIDDF